MEGSKSYASAYSFEHFNIGNTPDYDSLVAHIDDLKKS